MKNKNISILIKCESNEKERARKILERVDKVQRHSTN